MDTKAIISKVSQCRLDQNYPAEFGCGFCTKLIDLPNPGIDAWNERFDQTNHFMGESGFSKQEIQEWVRNKPRGEPHALDPLPERDGRKESSSPSRVAFQAVVLLFRYRARPYETNTRGDAQDQSFLWSFGDLAMTILAIQYSAEI